MCAHNIQLWQDSSVSNILLYIIAELQVLEFAYARYSDECSRGLHSNNPGKSCSEIFSNNVDRKDGYYWIETESGPSAQVYCARDPIPSRGEGPLRRVGYLDMTKAEQTCPSSFNEFTRGSKRLCARRGYRGGCSSVKFNTSDIAYSQICGRVKAYHYGSPSAFHTPRTGNDIDSAYLDGVSITHGNPRQHVWSFANALAEDLDTNLKQHLCPCVDSNYNSNVIPSFVGEDYFCDTGSADYALVGTLYTAHPLLDGEGVVSNSSSCFDKSQWFCKNLPEPTTDIVELRLCADEAQANEDSPIEQIEIYVK